MSIQLPAAIDLYLKAENSADIDVLSECFTQDAVVRDERRTYKGLAAIRKWKTETKAKYQHAVEPLGITAQGGNTLVKVRLAGNFPGSPIMLDFEFALEGRKIAFMGIHP